MTLPTLIAELEEAARAATPLPWTVHHKSKSAVEGGPRSEYTGFQQLVADSWTGRNDIDKANARLIALMRTHLPALIEAVKRQGEALELVLQNVEASASSYQERVETIGRVVRAALKEATDV